MISYEDFMAANNSLFTLFKGLLNLEFSAINSTKTNTEAYLEVNFLMLKRFYFYQDLRADDSPSFLTLKGF